MKLTLPLEEEDQAVHRGQLREAGLIKRVQLLHLHARATVASIAKHEYKYTQHQIPTMRNWQVHFCITVYNVSKTDGDGLKRLTCTPSTPKFWMSSVKTPVDQINMYMKPPIIAH